MENKQSKPSHSYGIVDLFTPHTELALLSSMRKSKTLTIMVTVFLAAFVGFVFLLYKMAS